MPLSKRYPDTNEETISIPRDRWSSAWREGCRGLVEMATGSVAGTFYGYPRFTHDVVLELPAERVVELARAFPLDQCCAPPGEVMRIEARRSLRSAWSPIPQTQRDVGFWARRDGVRIVRSRSGGHGRGVLSRLAGCSPPPNRVTL